MEKCCTLCGKSTPILDVTYHGRPAHSGCAEDNADAVKSAAAPASGLNQPANRAAVAQKT